MWTDFWASQLINLLDGCPVEDQCEVTYDRKLLIGGSDAVVFHPPVRGWATPIHTGMMV